MNQPDGYDEKDYSSIISPLTIETLLRYVEQKVPTGGFLEAVLANDFELAISRADHKNIYLLREILEYIRIVVPNQARGSYENVKNWLRNKNG